MKDKTYLYHYYPLRDIHKLGSIPNIEHATIKCLLEEYNKKIEPFTSLYRATFPLLEKKIWMNHAEELNDPYECLAYLLPDELTQEELNLFLAYSSPSAQFEILRRKNSGEKVIPYRALKDKYYGIFSLCRNYTELLMWSHYASGHSGLCIRFEVHREAIPAIKRDKMQIGYYVGGPMYIISDIQYIKQPLQISSESIKHYKEHKDSQREFDRHEISFSGYDLMHMMIMLSKSEFWTYEDEFRLITLGLEEEIPLSSLKYPNTNEPLLLPDAIIFGSNTHPIAKKIIQNSFNIPFFQATIENRTFKLKIDPINSLEKNVSESAEIY